MRADNDNDALPRTRAEAKAVGAKRYFTGRPCNRGHIAARLTSNRCCVECSMERAEAWKAANPERMTEYRKRVYAENRDEILSRWTEWYAANREDQLSKKRARYAENREDALAYAKKYRLENPDKVHEASARWRANNPEYVKEAWRQWYADNGKERDTERRSTPRGKLDDLMSRAIHGSLKAAKAGRKWESLVGYTINELMAHLESLFEPGMSFENHGRYGWHIDHKIPRSAFNYSDPSHIDFKRCWALENLQPLWWRDNLSKHAKLERGFQPSLALAEPVNDNSKHKETA